MTDLATAWRPFEPGIEKRFFIAEDGGSTWSIVAADRDHAIALLRAQGASWEVGSDCELEVDINTAILLGAVELREMRADEVARRKRCHRGRARRHSSFRGRDRRPLLFGVVNMNPLDEFVATTPAVVFEEVREEAARVCDETARYMRGERGPLRMPPNPEFRDMAFGVASEVAMTVANALKSIKQRFTADFPWITAATLLRAGWKRGHRLEPHVIGKGPKH